MVVVEQDAAAKGQRECNSVVCDFSGAVVCGMVGKEVRTLV